MREGWCSGREPGCCCFPMCMVSSNPSGAIFLFPFFLFLTSISGYVIVLDEDELLSDQRRSPGLYSRELGHAGSRRPGLDRIGGARL